MPTKLIEGNLVGRKATAIGIVADVYNEHLQRRDESKVKILSNIPIYGIPYTKITIEKDFEDFKDAIVIIDIQDNKKVKLIQLICHLILQDRKRNLDLIVISEKSKTTEMLAKIIDKYIFCKYSPKTKLCFISVRNNPNPKNVEKVLYFDASYYFKYFIRKYNKKEIK